MRKRSPWRFRAGARGYRVTVYEREQGGALYARTWHPARQRFVRRSLGHTDRDRAQSWAVDEARRLKEGRAELATGSVTLARVLTLYQQQHTPTKCASEQRQDAQRVELFTAFYGAGRDPLTLDEPYLWEAFLTARRSGAIDARGVAVRLEDREPKGDRILEQECAWLCWVLAWATRRKQDGRYLLARAPSVKQLRQSVTGWPTVRNARRPVASAERYRATRARAADVTPDLVTLLDLAYHTGRRLSQLCGLWYSDYLPDAIDPATGKRLPFGALRWRAETDKKRRERLAPLNREAQAALRGLLERRPGIGDHPMFPGPRRADKPLSRHVADHWLRRAEALAELPPLDGSAWHAYRRAWATARKHLPAVDVAEAGGWASVATLQTCYQRADMGTMLTVVTAPAEVREAGSAG
jgi:integrase